jgi:hypothetical protein
VLRTKTGNKLSRSLFNTNGYCQDAHYYKPILSFNLAGMVAAVRNEARDLANFESDLQIITIDTMQAAATKILPTSPSSSYRRPTYPFYSFRRLPPCAVFPIFPQDFLRPRTLLKPSYEMGRMRSRRRNVPGRTWPKEERTGGGGDGAASSSPRLTRRHRRLRVAQALVTLSLSRASWIFFHGSGGENFFPGQARKSWTGWAGL